jgi:hypothetical protein
MQDYMRVGPDGDPVLDFANLSRDQAAALQEVTVESYGRRLSRDQAAALQEVTVNPTSWTAAGP